jgi:hypothetical protein
LLKLFDSDYKLTQERNQELSKLNLNVNQSRIQNNDTCIGKEGFTEDVQTKFENLEVPYVFRNNKNGLFLLGTFMLQWGTSNSKTVKYVEQFDEAYGIMITPINNKSGKNNCKVRWISNERFNVRANSMERPFFWIAYGLKATSLKDTFL